MTWQLAFPRERDSRMYIYTKEIRIERDTCTPVVIAALFTIARTWKQPRYPLADEWITYTQWNITQLLKRMHLNQLSLMRWMKLEPNIQSEVSLKEKHQCCILTHMHIYRI